MLHHPGEESTENNTKRVVVIGSGSAALTAALAAKESGLDPLVVESTERIGGSSAMSGGGLWIPNNSLMLKAGTPDSYEDARTYMDKVIGDVGPASSAERREAFLNEGPKMVEWLTGIGYEFSYTPGYADYYPEEPGGSVLGRSNEPEFFNLKKLGGWQDKVNIQFAIPFHTLDAAKLSISFRDFSAFLHTAKVIGFRTIGSALIGKKLAGLGGALIGQLLHLALHRNIEIWTNSPLVELLEEKGKITGVIVNRNGQRIQIPTRAVILAAGGFAHNNEMRQTYHPHPITTDWTMANPGNQGGAIQAGMEIGADIALMDDAWWGPCFIDSEGVSQFMLWERSAPFSIIVDQTGKRFMNESASYVDCGHWMYERNAQVPAIPSFFISDSRHRKYYPFGMGLPGITPKKWIESGMMIKANSIPELAARLKMDPKILEETITRFNGFAETGKDLDFHRGDSAYDRVYSDPRVKPNPNLGAILKPPFYATKVYPGDLGTKGGLLTDEHARVLNKKGKVIEGLYAAGNCSASVMGRTYPGPGSTIGPAMVFGMIAGNHAASLFEE